MESLYDDNVAKEFGDDALALRVYTSQLIGKEPALVLHGGGNTSVKDTVENLFGEKEEVLFVKGSGWDLATIEKAGFAPVRLSTLLKMAKLETLSDTDMVKNQKAAMLDPSAPSPSVEAILHAIIPFKFVDHTHADAVVTLCNTVDADKTLKEVFDERVLILPYCMPGFDLARQIARETEGLDWQKIDAIVLKSHGVFTFADDAKSSYQNMIAVVSKAEDYLRSKNAFSPQPTQLSAQQDNFTKAELLKVAQLRKIVSQEKKAPMLIRINTSKEAIKYSELPNIEKIAGQGPLTPDHVISTKRVPLIIEESIEESANEYFKEYGEYFKKNTNPSLAMLDRSPRWAVWPGKGVLAIGPDYKRTKVIADMNRHTICAQVWAEKLGGWKALPEKDIFDCEYWELEQAKLKRAGAPKSFVGKVALVTGAAGGIGRACAERLLAEGACVVALDIQQSIIETFSGDNALGIVCDVTNPEDIETAVEQAIYRFGGLDILVSNAGTFPPGKSIETIDTEEWDKGVQINLSSHQYLLKACIPFLQLGWDSSVVVIASKNVPAPGPGAAIYSAAKAGLTQLARVAALELGPQGIRVNVVHPNAVFDTAIWTEEVLQNRAEKYGMSVEDYKRNNLMKTEVTSTDVAELVLALHSPIFAKTTGSQIPIDGGNDRVI